MKLQKKEVYAPVLIKEELPQNDNLVFALFGNTKFISDREWLKTKYGEGAEFLKKQTSYVFSEEELRSLLWDFYQHQSEKGLVNDYNTFEEKFNNLLKQD